MQYSKNIRNTPGGLAFLGIVLLDALPLSSGGIVFSASLVNIRLPEGAQPVRVAVLRAPDTGPVLLESFLCVGGAVIAAARLSANFLDFWAGVAPLPLSAGILFLLALLQNLRFYLLNFLVLGRAPEPLDQFPADRRRVGPLYVFELLFDGFFVSSQVHVGLLKVALF